MTVTKGKIHDFLGMRIEYCDDGTAEISMNGYLREAIQNSRLDIRREAATPATKDLFEVDETSPSLTRQEGDTFHSIVCKLLYVALRGRPDLLIALCFLTSRVTSPTAQDQRKLKRLLEYVNGSMDLVLKLGADDLAVMTTWVDAAYAVHPDSQTGGVMSFGTGGIVCKATKQKLNTKSSTEAELVGASDYLGNTIWVKNFMEAQGYPMESCYFEQDNQSAIQLEKNGRMSARQRSKHIDIRHFWITDRLDFDRITLRHCNTEHMLADFLTKPLQGNLFRKLRSVLLGHAHVDTLKLPNHVASEERVGEQTNGDGNEDRSRGDEHCKHVTWADVQGTVDSPKQ